MVRYAQQTKQIRLQNSKLIVFERFLSFFSFFRGVKREKFDD